MMQLYPQFRISLPNNRPHGGQGGAFPPLPQVRAQLHRSLGEVRVWQGIGGAREVFTIDEARALCTKADTALTRMSDGRSDGRDTGLWLDDGGALRPLIVSRDWLIAFVAALRGALKTWDRACALAEGARQ